MNKKLNSLLSLIFIFSIVGCNNNTSSSNNSTSLSSSNIINSSLSSTYTPKNEVEEIFYKLSKNNFTIDFSDSLFDLNNKVRNEKYYYTEYALQAEGDFGFSGIAQGNELIFKYTLEDNEVVSGAPLINYSNGTRYESIFEYVYGMNNFDYRNLSFEKDDQGYYIYEFGVNRKNDAIILPIFTRLSASNNALPPELLKFKIVKDVITFESVILSYDFDGDGILEGQSTTTAIVYDIGKTENPEIKQYLKDGKTSKESLDLRFYKLFHPYLFTQNYTLDLDGTDITSNFKFTEYCTEVAVYDHSDIINKGYMLNQGVITKFAINNDKVEILETPKKDESSFYTTIYGDVIASTFNDLDYSYLLGYKDENNENVYYLTDSYLVYILSYLCYNEIYEENYCDKVKLEIINDETHEFKLYFEMYNKKTNRELGTLVARFYDLNKTVIPAVDNYLSLGDNPNTQTKDDLASVLNKFKTHNYSMDFFIDGVGLAKYIYTEDYMYADIYGNKNINFGFMNVNDSIYEFYTLNNEVTLLNGEGDIDYASGSDPHTLPGLSKLGFGAYDDFGFISTISEELYDTTNYQKSSLYGQDYWAITDITLAYQIFNYYFNSPTSILPTGVGIVVKNDGDNSKLSFYLAYTSSDGQYTGYSYLTYYDLGITKNVVLDNYVNNL